MNQDGKADVWTMPPSSSVQFTTQQSYVYCTPSLRRRQSESTKENLLTGLSDLSSIENALPVLTNTSSIESFPKAVALLRRDSIINRSSVFTPIFFVHHYSCHFEEVSWQSRWGIWSLFGKKQRDCGGVSINDIYFLSSQIKNVFGVYLCKACSKALLKRTIILEDIFWLFHRPCLGNCIQVALNAGQEAQYDFTLSSCLYFQLILTVKIFLLIRRRFNPDSLP